MSLTLQESTDLIQQELARYLQRRFHASEEAVTLALEVHQKYLEGHTALQVPVQPELSLVSQDGTTPLLWEDGLLALTRCYREERRLAERFAARAQYQERSASEVLQAVRLLGISLHQWDPLQIAGAFLPFFYRLGLITGGPGTGKTTVLAILLALQLANYLEKGERLPRIALAAPTGKAAFRMGQSLANSEVLKNLPVELQAPLRGLIPQTLHRLLGIHSSVSAPRYNAEEQLLVDLVVLDESSMVSAQLMDQLLAAMPEKATLILLGDEHQLPSVEPGNVLGNLVQCFPVNAFSPRQVELISQVEHISQGVSTSPAVTPSPVIRLEKSFRFQEDKAIGLLAKAIRGGDLTAIEKLYNSSKDDSSRNSEVTFNPLDSEVALVRFCEAYQPFLTASTPEKALDALQEFMILTMTNEGPWGQRTWNDLLCKHLSQNGQLNHWPVMITANDAGLNLFNGDLGVAFRTDRLRVYFPRVENGQTEHRVRSFLEAQLPEHTTAFAMTVHKSQGSEFTNIALVLPEQESENTLLTRELLYTGLTRAKTQANLWLTQESLFQAVQTQEQRVTGLVPKLRQRLEVVC